MPESFVVIPAFPDPEDFPKPAAVDLYSGNTILVVVDMQNDFVRPEGKIYTGPMVSGIIEKISSLVNAARQTGTNVIYTQSWYEKDDPGFSDDPKARMNKGGCMAGSWGAEIIDELKPNDEEPVVKKSSYDPFYGTKMDEVLKALSFGEYSPGSVPRNRERNNSSVIITGTVSNVCVEKAVIGFYLRGFEVVIPVDCVAASSEYAQSWSLYQFSRSYRAKITCSDLIKMKEGTERARTIPAKT
jgi:nicotinamidase-related amidase